MLIKVEGIGEIEVEEGVSMYAGDEEGRDGVFLDPIWQGDTLPDVSDLTAIIKEKTAELFQRIVSAQVIDA